MNQLPQSWFLTTISEVCTANAGIGLILAAIGVMLGSLGIVAARMVIT